MYIILRSIPLCTERARPTCKVCGRSYKSLVYLRRHEPVHRGATRCPVCLQVYSSISNLTQHMRSVHDLPLPEGITPRSQKRLAREAFHRRIQEGAEPAGAEDDGEGSAGSGAASGRGRGRGQRCVCDVCGRSYKSPIYLRRHLASHFGSTKCPECGNVYSTAWNLRFHMRSQHGLDPSGAAASTLHPPRPPPPPPPPPLLAPAPALPQLAHWQEAAARAGSRLYSLLDSGQQPELQGDAEGDQQPHSGSGEPRD
ncbi:Fez family zinc finger protein 1 [Amphibalanus amphitrite]|uniref:Fez family zinc finger protein 1 n=1 Tax=Amphibalanus amphitrite TaxID=1232801 RepID=A0A6A4X9A8_AMPAM|nr:Fez family zinc finger protein 1 [Amphibalanus amphitrite]